MKKFRLYLDNSVLNRPFDDQKQGRVWLETLAFSLIFSLIECGEAEMIVSVMHVQENDRCPSPNRQHWVRKCLAFAGISVIANDAVEGRARRIRAAGVKLSDALHAALAEEAGATHLLTCDDGFLRRYSGPVTVMNPQMFIASIDQYED